MSDAKDNAVFTQHQMEVSSRPAAVRVGTALCEEEQEFLAKREVG